jgi:hypothetical protein
MKTKAVTVVLARRPSISPARILNGYSDTFSSIPASDLGKSTRTDDF